MVNKVTKYPQNPILLVDDEPEILEGCEFILQSHGFDNVITCQDSSNVMAIIKQNRFAVILLDLMMPKPSGKELLETLSQNHPEIPVIVLTGMNDLETAVSCMKLGAIDYMVKPVEEQRLVNSIKRAIERQEEKAEYQTFRKLVLGDKLQYPEAFAEIITSNKNIRSIFQYAEAISTTRKTVLITGESGVGKELMAKSIHQLSRPEGPFVPVNIAGLDDNLLSDALFGHLKGAFTGADSNRSGLIETASGGTLFLDEIGDLNPTSQIKLLRLLEDGEYFPVGADVPRASNTRIIAATNQDLQKLREEKLFRTDLYYRMQTHHIHMPKLKERLDDLPLLVDHFLEQSAASLGKRKPTPPKELVSLLASYHFPGNVRELQSMVFDAVSHHQSKVLSLERFKKHIDKHLNSKSMKAPLINEFPKVFSLFDKLPTLRDARNLLVDEAMERSNGNITIASKILGISRSGLSKLLKRSEPNEEC